MEGEWRVQEGNPRPAQVDQALRGVLQVPVRRRALDHRRAALWVEHPRSFSEHKPNDAVHNMNANNSNSHLPYYLTLFLS